MCNGGAKRERVRQKNKARKAQREADRRAENAQRIADRQAAQREQLRQDQIAEKNRLADLANQNKADQRDRITAATAAGMQAEQDIRDSAAAEEARIAAEAKRKAAAIRTAGGAMSSSMSALNADKKDAKAPTAGSTKGKPKASGPRATAALVQRGSARTRGTNLSI